MKKGESVIIKQYEDIKKKILALAKNLGNNTIQGITKGRPLPENIFRYKLPMTLADLEIISEDSRKISPFHQKRLEMNDSTSMNLPAETIMRQREMYKDGEA